MAKSDSEKTIEILVQTETVADQILMNKQEIVQLDKRRQETREAIREIEKAPLGERKVWTAVGSLLVKLEKPKALELLKKDQVQIDSEINKLRSEQKLLVNKHRDLEHQAPFSGTDLKPLDRKEFAALKANLPLF